MIIPAKMGSSRLPNKNLQLFGENTLTKCAFDYAKMSVFVDEIIISTDADSLTIFGDLSGAQQHKRKDKHLGEAPLIDVIKDVADCMRLASKNTIVVCLQPDHVGREMSLDESLKFLSSKGDVILKSKELDGSPSGAYYMAKLEDFLNPKAPIFYVADKAFNIHYLDDLDQARKSLL